MKTRVPVRVQLIVLHASNEVLSNLKISTKRSTTHTSMLSQRTSSKARGVPIVLAIAAAAATIVSLGALCSAVESNDTKLRTQLLDIEPCVIKSMISFHIKEVYPPTSTETLRTSCRLQAEGFKCIKEKAKELPTIVKRGLTALIQTRQRHHKKYCTNVNSELSQNYVKDIKCVMEKKLPVFKDVDIIFANKLIEIYKRNFNDSGMELKFLCCSLVLYRKAISSGVGPECTKSAASIEELMTSIVSHDLDLICEDDDKLLTKVCPSLPQMNLSKKMNDKPGLTPSVLALYLVATLGEAQKSAPVV